MVTHQPLGELRVTSPYGWRGSGSGRNFHTGVDLAAPIGKPAYAVFAGNVTRSDFYRRADGSPSYGHLVVVRSQTHPQWTAWYAHLDRRRVSVGDSVPSGGRIGDTGCSGRCFGPHLHFELRNSGRHTDPWPYIKQVVREEGDRMTPEQENRLLTAISSAHGRLEARIEALEGKIEQARIAVMTPVRYLLTGEDGELERGENSAYGNRPWVTGPGGVVERGRELYEKVFEEEHECPTVVIKHCDKGE